MKGFNSALSMSALVVAISASFVANDAQAVVQSRSFITNPVGICQAALPAFEGAIRKRPLAVQNEGTTNAFVTCSFTSQGTDITSVSVWFAASDSAPHPINCTGVSGFNTGPNQFIAKVGAIPASGQTSLTWTAADFSGAPATFPSARFSISCNLEPGAGINDSQLNFSEDVGA